MESRFCPRRILQHEQTNLDIEPCQTSQIESVFKVMDSDRAGMGQKLSFVHYYLAKALTVPVALTNLCLSPLQCRSTSGAVISNRWRLIMVL